MPITVFYCWQSDRDRNVCYRLIRDAATDAIARLKANAAIEDAPELADMRLDSGTSGVPGIPKVAETIKRKIAACDVFIADVTHVAEYVTADGRKKSVPNGNVLIELGQALVQKSEERILLVMNTAFGSFADLPFDLRLHRKPLLYTLSDTADKGKVRAEQEALTKKLAEALALMVSDIASREATERAKATSQAIELRRKDADRLRNQFEQSVEQGEFKPFVPDRPMLALTLVPLIPPVEHIDFARHEVAIRKGMTPFWTAHWDHKYFETAFATHNVTKHNPDGGCDSSATTAIHLDGSICAAAVLRLDKSLAVPGAQDVLHFADAERAAIIRVTEYIHLLRELQVTGPIMLGLSLLRVNNTYLTGYGIRVPYDGGRILSEDSLRPPMVEIPAAHDGISDLATASAMRPLLDRIWRSANYPRDPFINSKGEWISTA